MAILSRRDLNTLLLISQELHMEAQRNLVRIYILIKAIYIQNKRAIDVMSSGVKGQNSVFTRFSISNWSRVMKFGR